MVKKKRHYLFVLKIGTLRLTKYQFKFCDNLWFSSLKFTDVYNLQFTFDARRCLEEIKCDANVIMKYISCKCLNHWRTFKKVI